jgi:L-cysteine/cystine lyase
MDDPQPAEPAAGVGPAGPGGAGRRSPVADGDAERARVAAIREGLPALRAGIFLDAGTCGPLPSETAAAMAEVAARELVVGRAHRDVWPETQGRLDEARAAVAAILTTDVDLVAITHSTTEGCNLAVGSAGLRPGDRVVTTNLEHPGLLGPLAVARDRCGVELVVADVGDGGDDGRTLAALEAAMGSGTRLVAASHVAWSTGAVLPVGRIVALAHERGAVAVIDGAQAAGAIPVEADAIGADFYATSGQKWLLGPEGTGALHVRRGLHQTVVPPVAGFASYASADLAGDGVRWPDARRFETAGFHAPSVAGLARSAGWLAMIVGLPWAHRRAARLARVAADRFAAMSGVTLLTPPDRMATLVSFRVAGWSAEAVVEQLERRVHAIARSIPGRDIVRFSIGFFTAEEELGRALDAVAEIAAHTPRTLPARPSIEFVSAAEG